MNRYRFFSKQGPFSVDEIAAKIGGKVVGNGNEKVSDVGTLEGAKPGDISFLVNKKYTVHLAHSKAAACIVDQATADEYQGEMALIVHPNPHEGYAIAASMFYVDENPNEGVSEHASVSKSAKIGKDVSIEAFAVICDDAEIGDGCHIGANSYIGQGVVIGKGTRVMPNVTITHALVGEFCHIYTGVRIGQDGFGFAKTSKGMMKVVQFGCVIIGNYVEIGANTCIDRGAIEDTIIGDGTKIDNQVQIGHNCVIGRSSIICGQVGLAGTSKVGDFVMLGGQVGVAGHLEIGMGSMVAAQSGVMSDLPAKSIVGGSPAMPIREWHKSNAIIRRMLKKGKGDSDGTK